VPNGIHKNSVTLDISHNFARLYLKCS